MAAVFICFLMFFTTDLIDPLKWVNNRFRITSERKAEFQLINKYDNGQLMFRTQLKKGLLQGSWESWYGNGMKRDSGRIRSNIPDGEWKIWHRNGHLMYQLHFNSIKYHNIQNEIDRQPKYKLYHISELPKDAAKNHLKSPFSVLQIRYQSLWKNHRFSAEIFEKILHAEIDLYSSPFEYALLHGSYVAFHENGELKEQGVYINGLRDGVWEENSPEGFIQRGTYHHGKKYGEWRIYNSSGQPILLKHYNHQGKLISQYKFKQ